MKCLLLLALSTGMVLTGNTQFIYHPLPLSTDHAIIAAKKFTRCMKYEVTEYGNLLLEELRYDERGMPVVLLVKGTNDDGDSTDISKTTFRYLDNGWLKSSVFVDYYDGIEENTLYTYDASNKLIKKESASIDPPTYVYSYDEKGRLKKVELSVTYPETDSLGEFTGKSVMVPSALYLYEHDAKGRILKENYYDIGDEEGSPTTPSFTFIWTYDDKGRISSITGKTEDGETGFESRFAYNADGLLLSETGSAWGEAFKYIFEYQ